MKVSCSQCPAKYGIPDSKVVGRRIRICCKKCGAPIYIDGTVSPPVAADRPPSVGSQHSAREVLRSGTASGKRIATAPPLADGAPHQPRNAIPARSCDATAASAPSAPKAAATSIPRRATERQPAQPGLRGSAPRDPGTYARTDKATTGDAPRGASSRASKVLTRPPHGRGDAGSNTSGSRRGEQAHVNGLGVPAPESSRIPAAPPKHDTASRTAHPAVPRPSRVGNAGPSKGISAPQRPNPSRAAKPARPPAVVPPTVWLVALSEELQEERTTDQLIALYKQRLIDAETVVWRDGMDQWQGVFEVPELVDAMASRGIRVPPQGKRSSRSGVSGVRSVSITPDGGAHPPDCSLRRSGASTPEAPSTWDDPQATAVVDSSVTLGLGAPHTDLEDEKTIALDRDEAEHPAGTLAPPGGTATAEDDDPTRLFYGATSNSPAMHTGLRPAAGRSAISDSARASGAGGPPFEPTIPPPAPARQVRLVVAFAVLVTIVVLLAVIRRVT